MYKHFKRRSFSFLLSLITLVTFSVTTLLFPYMAAAQTTQSSPDSVSSPVNKGYGMQNAFAAPPEDLPAKPGTARTEITSARTEYSQRFLNPDGTFTEEVSAAPKFYKDKNTWVPIINDIVSDTNGSFKYKNGANKFHTYFCDNGHVRYEDKDGSVDFQPVGASSVLDLTNNDKIKYFQLYNGTDFQYSVESSRLKEEIDLNSYTGKNTFSFYVNTNGLIIRTNPDTGLLTLYNKKNQPVAQLDAPFMVDASGNRSDNVTLQLTKQAGQDVLVLSADANWLADSSRKFPVVIDPSISQWSVGKDTFIASGAPSTNYSSATYLSVGKDATLGTTRTFVQFNLPTLPAGAQITSAKMGFYQTVNNGSSTVDLYRLTSNWTSSATTWNNAPTTGASAESSLTSSNYNYYWYFYDTQLVKEWYSQGGTTTPNYGVMLRNHDETVAAKQFVSLDAGYNIPVITITYTIDPIGTQDFWTYAKGVNVFNGNLVAGATDTGMPGRGSVGFSRTYNSRAAASGVLGYGWTANVFSYIKPNTYGTVVLVDDTGTEHTFTRNIDGTYNSPPGEFLYLAKNSDSTYTVTHMDGTTVNFDVNGKLTTIVDTNGNTTTFNYDSVTGRLSNVTDASQRATSFAYDANGRVQTITDPAYRTVNYSYDANGNLTQVSSNGNTVNYGYDTNHNLTGITDPRNKTVSYSYTIAGQDSVADHVYQITSNITVNGTLTPSTTTFSYGTNSTTVTNANNIQTVYNYDNEGKVTSIAQDPTGANIVTSLGYDSDKNVNQVTDPKNGIYTAQYQQGTGNLLNDTNSVNQTVYRGYDANNNQIQVTDPAGNISTSGFDGKNNNIDNADPTLQASASRYNSYGTTDWETAQISATDNLAYNPSIEKGTTWPDDWWSWKTSGSTATFTWETTGKLGARSVSISNPTNDAVVFNNRSITTDFVYKPNTSYVISGYVSTQNLAQNAAYLEVDAYNSTGGWLGFVTSPKLGGTNDWTRLQLVVNKDTLPAGTASINVGFGATTTTGKALFDGMQIEPGNVASTYNMVENPSMEVYRGTNGIPDYWSGVNLTAGVDKQDSTQTLVGSQAFKIVGASGLNKAITQHINYSGNQNNKLTVSGWAYADNPDPNGGWWLVQTKINYTDNTSDWTNANDFDKTKPGQWQHVAAYVKPTKAFSSIDVFYYFYNQRGNAWFDAMKLQEGDIITSYQYDTNHNYTTSITSAAGTVSYGYDSYGNQNQVTDVMGNVTNFSFDPLNRLTQVTQPTITVNGQPTRYVTNYGYDANGNRTSVTDANNHTTNYSYNEWNQISSTTDAVYNTTYYSYDVLGRNAKVQYPNNNSVSFSYDNVDRMNSLQGSWTGGSFNYGFTYDNNGNVTAVTDNINNKTTTYQFNPDNVLYKVTEPGGSNIVSYVYDALDQITGLTATVGGTNYTTNYSYDSLGQLTKVDAGNGNNAAYSYDENGNVRTVKDGNGVQTLYSYVYNDRLDKLSTFSPGGVPMRSFKNAYDGDGNITQVTMDGSVQGNVYYTYDTLNRLTRETLLDGTTVAYQYDAVGNRTQKKVNGSPINYIYDSANELTSVNGVVYSYDANGNMTSDGSRDFLYDAANRLIQVRNHATQANIASFSYDATGRRTYMNTVYDAVYFHYDGNSANVLYETDANNVIKVQYTYDKAGNRVSMTYNGQTYFYQYNGHGDVVGLTDSTGAVVATYDYDAFGNPVGAAPMPGSVGDVNPYRYAGYRWDKDTGLYYLNARYYWAGFGRFITRDTFEDDPPSMNLYNYCQNNPVNSADPSGHWTVQSNSQTVSWIMGGGRINEDLKIMIATVWGEAADQGIKAVELVSDVIMNRIGKREWRQYHSASAIIKNTGFDAYTSPNQPFRNMMSYLNNRTLKNRILENAIRVIAQVYYQTVNDISSGACLYYSPKANHWKIPPWVNSRVIELYFSGINRDYFRFFKYK